MQRTSLGNINPELRVDTSFSRGTSFNMKSNSMIHNNDPDVNICTTITTGGGQTENSSLSFNLHVCGIKYDFGKICTFCDNLVSVWYCIDCKDFLCSECDIKLHDVNIRNNKRKFHKKRVPLSRYKLSKQGQIIINFFRFIYAREILRRKVRLYYRRYYDPKSQTHYYVRRRRSLDNNNNNTWQSDDEIQWFKPLSLGNEELCPFLNEETASVRLQSFIRCYSSRILAVKLCHDQYSKLYDLETGKFYYSYNGIPSRGDSNSRVKSILVPSWLSWRKPKTLKQLHQDLPVCFDSNTAILRLQLFCRSLHTRRKVREKVRQEYEECIDPLSGKKQYRLKNFPEMLLLDHKPCLLGNEEWNPDNVLLWDERKVHNYFRSLGFGKKKKGGQLQRRSGQDESNDDSKLFHMISRFSINGPILLLLEHDDYKNILQVRKSIQIKRIQIDLCKRLDTSKSSSYQAQQRHDLIDHIHIHHCKEVLKLDKIRTHVRMTQSAILIQNLFRRRIAKNFIRRFKKSLHDEVVSNIRSNRNKRFEKVVWWSEMIRDSV